MAQRIGVDKRSVMIVLVVAVFSVIGWIVWEAVSQRKNRVHVALALAHSNSMKNSVNEYYAKYGRTPSALAEIPEKTRSEFATSDRATGTYRADGTLVITLPGGADKVAGQTIILSPKAGAHGIEWDCKGGTVPDVYRPSACRAGQEGS